MVIEPIDTGLPTTGDLAEGFLLSLGVSSSHYKKNYPAGSYCDKWELMDPELVEDSAALPEYWKRIYDMHMQPNMRDCRDLRYYYIHSPVTIMCYYPTNPCAGIFCVSERKPVSELRRYDLVNINSDIEEYYKGVY